MASANRVKLRWELEKEFHKVLFDAAQNQRENIR